MPDVSIGQKKANQSDKYVSLGDAHKGMLEIDLRIMNQFGDQSQEVQAFYVACREALNGEGPKKAVAKACQKLNRHKLGGPMLGNAASTSVAVWMHLLKPAAATITVTQIKSGESKTFQSMAGNWIFSVGCDGLLPDTGYSYTIVNQAGVQLGNGQFVTPPEELSEKPWRIPSEPTFTRSACTERD